MGRLQRNRGVIGALLVSFGIMLFAMIFLPVVNEVSKALTAAFMETNLAENTFIVFLWEFFPIGGAVVCMIGGVMLVLQSRNGRDGDQGEG